MDARSSLCFRHLFARFRVFFPPTIENRRDCLATILVAPLILSARIPFTCCYSGVVPIRRASPAPQGLVSLLYVLGTVIALLVAKILRLTLLKGPTPYHGIADLNGRAPPCSYGRARIFVSFNRHSCASSCYGPLPVFQPLPTPPNLRSPIVTLVLGRA